MLDCLGGVLVALPGCIILGELFLRDMKAGRTVLRDPSPLPYYAVAVLLATTSLSINGRELAADSRRWSAWLTNVVLAALNLVVAFALGLVFSWMYVAIRFPR